jgi:transposase
MGRGKTLTEFEKGQINGLHQSGKGLREIARSINRTPFVVRSYLNDPQGYGTHMRNTGRPSKLSPRDKRLILRTAAAAHRDNETKYASTIRGELGLNVSNRTVSRVLNKSEFFETSHLQKAPKLKPEHIEARKAWARENMNCNWNTVSNMV